MTLDDACIAIQGNMSNGAGVALAQIAAEQGGQVDDRIVQRVNETVLPGQDVRAWHITLAYADLYHARLEIPAGV